MVYRAYQLRAFLNNLCLIGQEKNGDLMWLGTVREWENAENEEEDYLAIPF